jgi:hypothetical protein
MKVFHTELKFQNNKQITMKTILITAIASLVHNIRNEKEKEINFNYLAY